MKKFLNPRVHGYLDYVVVVWFLAAPTLFGLLGIPAAIAYLLAPIHLILTLLSAFPLGLVKVIPFQIHGTIELIVSLTLIALPWLFGFASVPSDRNFYLFSGIMIFLVWLITDYKIARSVQVN